VVRDILGPHKAECSLCVAENRFHDSNYRHFVAQSVARQIDTVVLSATRTHSRPPETEQINATIFLAPDLFQTTCLGA
jgi:hypothetical protein